MNRLLISTAALLGGVQFAFLNPALALLLVTVFHASAAEVGWMLALYNGSGFVASLVLPAYADRNRDYLRPMLLCGVLSIALALVLATVSSVPVVVIALVVLGGPAGVSSSLLFAQLKHTGATLADVLRTRAYVSVAWVGGPPLATVIMGAFGSRAIVVAIAVVAALNTATTVGMLARRPTVSEDERPLPATDDGPDRSRLGVVLIVVAFVVLQATNYTVVSVMSLFVTDRLGLNVIWAGVALGVAAALEIPALLVAGRLSRRYSSVGLLVSGCVAGVAFYVVMTFASGPVVLIAAQVLNAWFFATIAGVGLALFQEIIPRPGLASGLYTNTRRLGAIAGGPLIAIGSRTSLGYSGIFAACAVLTSVALVVLVVTGRLGRRPVSA